ncbi:MAG: NAD-glutamate dehydrogenase [Gemmatimonadota bacterium]|nr:MAG: NAD-glutamate dehydrogenase [Gemmatimonadota bacterium]
MDREAKDDSGAPLLEAVLEGIEAGGDAGRSQKLRAFARAVLSRAPADFFRGRTDAEVFELVSNSFDLLDSTAPGDIGVRVAQRPGYGHTGTAAVVIRDRPFVVDTLHGLLTSKGFEIRNELHPIVVVERDEAGKVAEVRDWSPEGPNFAVPYVEFEGHLDLEIVRSLEAEARHCLEEVRVATDDFQPMLKMADFVCEELQRFETRHRDRATEVDEIIAFLQWLKDGGFVFLGYRGYDLRKGPDGRRFVSVERGSGLGILRRESDSSAWEPKALDELPPDLRARALLGPLLIVSKTNSESRVHRRARMDYVGIKKLDEAGEVIGEHRFLGLFTWAAYSEYSGDIPVLRRKLEKVLAAERLPEGSHDYKALVQLFNDMPKEELFLVSVEDLRQQIRAVLAAEDTGDVRLLLTPDILGRGVIVMVILPKRNYSDEVRGRLRGEIAEALGGSILNDHLALGEGQTARMHFYVSASPQRIAEIDLKALRDHAASIARTWKQRLRGALGDRHGAEGVHRLEETYFDAFSAEYVATVDVDTAVEDIERLEALERTGLMQVAMEPYESGDLKATELRLFVRRGTMILADTMPILENLGLRVIQADALDIDVSGKGAATIHTFVVQGPDRGPLDHAGLGVSLTSTLRGVHSGRADNDRLNRLVISAGLAWEEVAVLRAYSAYAFQVGAVPSRRAAPDALIVYPEVARLLFENFRTKFDPGLTGDRTVAVGAAGDRFRDSLQAVDSIADDLTLRRLHNLIEATVRTSYFRNRSGELDCPRLTFKFDCATIEQMPQPRPAREMFVHSVRVAGAHLRFGAVARGGIRWSERPDDFRTEVLGLVKTQQTKNAVIVPSGAKGAFCLRRPPTDRAELGAEVRDCYRDFIAGLLDVTDNIVDGAVVHPPDTVAHDGEDPYLVVAADKGTAAFSDTANQIAAQYGFWMGDAFASGGSHGYDHKKEGITARGAWECVKRHFREMGVDIMREPLTVVGIGDMGGDVFGNGMLLSRTIRLIAAFDHRNIFIDPDPDPETSYQERLRLFRLPTSSWLDYDTSLISEGGGVYPRGAKEIRLSPQARRALGADESVVNGQALIRLILQAPVDLLWNGGIGTYVKAPEETHAEVGDSSNDAVRIDSNQLRVKVVGEGGNLGLTQRARIEYALEGGRINTDAVDNSGGVDMSDHEVNLKILLRALVDRGELSPDERNEMLERVTDIVAVMVLGNNRSQARALSLEQLRARERLGEFRDASYYLEQNAGLSRSLESLPGWSRLQQRQELGKSLTRPELAILLAYAKLHLKRSILESALPDDPALVQLLHDYFPDPVVVRVTANDLRNHRLRREIAATVLTSRLIDLMGCTLVPTVTRDTGASPVDVARGWFVAAEIAGVGDLLERIEKNEASISADQELRWLLALEGILDRTVRWAVENLPREPGIGAAIETFKGPVAELNVVLPSMLLGSQREAFEATLAELQSGGVPRETAEKMAALQFLGELMEITRISQEVGFSVADVGRVYFALTDEVDFALLLELLNMAAGEDVWEQRAVQGLMQDMGEARRNLTLAVLALGSEETPIDERLDALRERHVTRLGAIREVLGELVVPENINVSALAVATREVVRQSRGILGGRD